MMRWHKIIITMLIIIGSGSSLVNSQEVRFIDRTSLRFADSFATSAGDVDGDGDLDLFVCHHLVSGLFLNNGKGEFGPKIPLTTIEQKYNARNADFVDVDNDEDWDVYVYNFGMRHLLFINDGFGMLIDETEKRLSEYGEANRASGGLADVDKDGDLDIICPPKSLLLNDGTGRFTDDALVRLPPLNAQTEAVALGDVNGDSHIDIFLANWDAQNQLLINDGAGYFTDETALRIPRSKDLSRRVKLVDIDNDADLDVIVCNRNPALLINNGLGIFSDETDKWFPSLFEGTSFDADCGDVDADGMLDLVVMKLQEIQLLLNQDGKFVDVTEYAIPAIFDQHLSGKSFNSVQLADVDNDNDLDIVTNLLIFYNEHVPLKIFDQTPPNLTIVEPVDQSVIGKSQQQVGIHYSDMDAGVDVRSLQILVNGIDRSSEFNIKPDNAYTRNINWLREGSNNIEVQIKDNLGNVAAKSSVFQVDPSVIPLESKLESFDTTGIARTEFTRGEHIIFQITLYNRTGVSRALTQQLFDFYVGEQWQWSYGKGFQPFTQVVVPPLQTKSLSAVWDGRDSRGLLVPAGIYTVRGESKTHPRKGVPPTSIQISIVPSTKPLLFTDITVQSMPQETQDESFPHTVPSGKNAVWGDFDLDGQLDLLVINYNPNYLYHNQGDGTFFRMIPTGFDTTDERMSKALTADYDGDGDLDIGVTRDGLKGECYILLYRNDGDLRFTDVTNSALPHQVDSRCDAVWGDFNGDGHLDLFAATESGNHALYQNDGNGAFSNVIQQTGIHSPKASQTQVIAIDYNNDGNLDLHLLSGSNKRNQLYHNNSDGTFTDAIQVSGLQTLNHQNWRIKYVWGDLNGDNLPDVIVSDRSTGLQIYFNNSDATFREMTLISGLSRERCEDITLVDYNQDGALDIYMFNRLYWNRGDGTFIKVTGETGITSIEHPHRAVFGDYDGDGDLDLYLVRSSCKNLLFRRNN